MQAQEALFPVPAPAQPHVAPTPPPRTSASALPYPVSPSSTPLYPWMGDFMGMELSEDVTRANMPEYSNNGGGRAVVPSNAGQVRRILIWNDVVGCCNPIRIVSV